jgi:hypothetical protein
MAREMSPTFQGQEWLVLINRDNRRQMSTREVRAELQAGRLASETLVWRAGMNAWAAIGSIAELASPSARPTVPSGRPGGHNRRFAETIASNHRIAQQYAALRAAQRKPVRLQLIATGAAVLLTVVATSYTLYTAGVFRAGSADGHPAPAGAEH